MVKHCASTVHNAINALSDDVTTLDSTLVGYDLVSALETSFEATGVSLMNVQDINNEQIFLDLQECSGPYMS